MEKFPSSRTWQRPSSSISRPSLQFASTSIGRIIKSQAPTLETAKEAGSFFAIRMKRGRHESGLSQTRRCSTVCKLAVDHHMRNCMDNQLYNKQELKRLHKIRRIDPKLNQ